MALLRCERLRKHATTAFLLSLTFSDLLFCLIMMPMQAVRFYHRAWTFGEFLCQVFPFVFYSNVCVSMLSMILMTINRYILITFQHLYPKIYQRNFIVLQLFLAWFISFLIMVRTIFLKKIDQNLFFSSFSHSSVSGASSATTKKHFPAQFSRRRGSLRSTSSSWLASCFPASSSFFHIHAFLTPFVSSMQSWTNSTRPQVQKASWSSLEIRTI